MIKDGNEECDDGNNVFNVGCLNCKVQIGYQCVEDQTGLSLCSNNGVFDLTVNATSITSDNSISIKLNNQYLTDDMVDGVQIDYVVMQDN